MRAIKFRVFDKTTEEMYFPGEDDTQLVIGISHALDKNYMALWCNEGEIGREGDMVFSQFTGLYDKDGVEIHEGDVLKESSTHPLLIFIKEGHTQISFKDFGTTCEEFIYQSDIDDMDIAVVGNIYENPELLEVPE